MKHSCMALLAASLALAASLRGQSAFQSSHLAVDFHPTAPAFSWFAVDSLGRGENLDNPIDVQRLPHGSLRLQAAGQGRFSYRTLQGGSSGLEEPWEMEVTTQQIILRSRHTGTDAPPFLLLFDQKRNHATLLGLPGEAFLQVRTPAVLHLPDRGTLRITASDPTAVLGYDARRGDLGNFVQVTFPAASAERPLVEYRLETILIHPDLPGLTEDPRYDGYRRNFLNLIQYQPRLGTLANNSSSDACGFVFWQYGELARQAPPLADGLTVMDLLRVSLERVINGQLTYGQAGYAATEQYPDAAPWAPAWDSLDTRPSFVIAGSHYILGTADRAWADRRLDWLVTQAREMLAEDRNGNGLIEYRLSGNSGSWTGRERPANWWDTIGFGHEDAFSNALAYRACRLLSEAGRALGRSEVEREFAGAADRIRAAYVPTFLNPASGLLAGWKSEDGELHDYAFTFINGIAVAFGLVDEAQAHQLLDRLQARMVEAGFHRFDLGLPGNLVPIRREDYTDLRRRFGGPSEEDGSDAFQIYENGAATHCHAYWTIKAFYRLGRVTDARRIFYPMLRSFAKGNFQGFCDNGLSKDWRSWDGVCNGYEGYLSDGFITLLAVADDLAAESAQE